jgi:glutamate-1-semialdehyde 2,1-aminomutase
MNQSKSYFNTATHLIPGGVNSPVRAFKSVGRDPLFISKAKGSYITDVDGKEYIDYVGSWGPMILGHADSDVIKSIQEQANDGISYGAPCVHEITLAKTIVDLVPSIDMIRFVNSGTEATMSAIRLARAYTKRDKFIKFNGCYHGHADQLLVNAGSGMLTLGEPSSPGVPIGTAKDTLTAEYNDIDLVEALFNKYPHQISSIIIEPIAGNMNMIKPTKQFIHSLQALCHKHGALLIFDEVMTGFRVSPTGAQGLYDINPDLTTFGKIIGGGMPVGAFGGKKEIMELISPVGPVYQAGTLSGNPLAMIAGITTLKKLQAPNIYHELKKKTDTLINGLNQAAAAQNYPFHAISEGSMFGMFFNNKKSVLSFQDVKNGNSQSFINFFNHMLNKGIYIAPSEYEAGFISYAHSQEDINNTINAAAEFFQIEN